MLSCHDEKKFSFKDYFYLFTLFQCLFALTSQSPMSKLFRFSESLGKSNGNKWSQIWKLLLIKDIQLPRKRSLFIGEFCLARRIFLVPVLLSTLVGRFFVSCRRDLFKFFLYLTDKIDTFDWFSRFFFWLIFKILKISKFLNSKLRESIRFLKKTYN